MCLCVLVGACSQWEIQLADPRGVHVGDTFSGVLWQWRWSGWEGTICLITSNVWRITDLISHWHLIFFILHLLFSLEQVSPLPKNRSPLSSNGCGGSNFARWSTTNCPNDGAGSRPCQTYENLDFLYKNPSANSASAPPPLPAKVIQRGEMILNNNKKKNLFLNEIILNSVFCRPYIYLTLSLIGSRSLPQVVQTPRFQSQHRKALPNQGDPLTRPPTLVRRHRPGTALLHPAQKAKAKWGNHQSPHTGREVCSGHKSRAGRVILVLVRVLKAVSLRTTSGLSGKAILQWSLDRSLSSL